MLTSLDSAERLILDHVASGGKLPYPHIHYDPVEIPMRTADAVTSLEAKGLLRAGHLTPSGVRLAAELTSNPGDRPCQST